MAGVRSVAAYLYSGFLSRYHKPMDEMKMHKLMYFSQRESLMLYNRCLFDEDFFGWKYGPVLKSVRNEYSSEAPYASVRDDLMEEEKELLDSVMDRYGDMSSWKLSSLSHAELSWRKSRAGLRAGQNGNVKLELSAMMVDAAREKAFRRKQS